MKKKYETILQKYFGHETLKDLQYEIIESCITGNDTIALLPTSYGKSICYQLPHLITKKNVVVVSPLISLMEDQMQDLKSKNIDAICLNSTNKKKSDELSEVYKGKNKIIYTTPEYLLRSPEFIEKLICIDSLALIAIDECHCISSWGYGFRSDYQKLGFLKEYAPDIPILALSATVTKQVLDDIKNNLNLNDPKIIRESADRKNLYIEIDRRDDSTFEEKVVPLIKKYHENGRIIIYCKTIDETNKLAEKTSDLNFRCAAYHGKKTEKERTEIQSKFTNNEIKIIVSTVAFGMGINIPDIRVLIHYNCANNIESYMQEIGRAGRDGKESYCYLFYNEKDFLLNHLFLKDVKNPEIKEQREKELLFLQQYVRTSNCRRKFLLGYFGETLDQDCKNCDNCVNGRYDRDFTKEACMLLGLVNTISKLSKGTYIKLLRGSKSKDLSKYISQIGNYHGIGKVYNEDWWKKLFELLQINGYLVEEKIILSGKLFCAIVIKLSVKGSKWLLLQRSDDKNKLIFSVPNSFGKIDATTSDLESEYNSFKKMFT